MKAFDVERYDALHDERAAGDARSGDARRRILAAKWREREPDAGTVQLLRRARFAGVSLDLDALARQAAAGARALADIDIASALPWDTRGTSTAPRRNTLTVPSGRTTPLTTTTTAR